MMWSEFLEKTGCTESFCTYRDYTDFIEPAYMATPEFVNKDMFCTYFYDMYKMCYIPIVEGLISAHTTEELIHYINGSSSIMSDVTETQKNLWRIFLHSFSGMSKSHWREIKLSREV